MINIKNILIIVTLVLCILVYAIILLNIQPLKTQDKLVFKLQTDSPINNIYMRYPYLLFLTNKKLLIYSLQTKKNILIKEIKYTTLDTINKDTVILSSGWTSESEKITYNIGVDFSRKEKFTLINKYEAHPYIASTKSGHPIIFQIKYIIGYHNKEYVFGKNKITWVADALFEEPIFSCDIDNNYFYYAYLDKKNRLLVKKVDMHKLIKNWRS